MCGRAFGRMSSRKIFESLGWSRRRGLGRSYLRIVSLDFVFKKGRLRSSRGFYNTLLSGSLFFVWLR